MRDKTWQNLEPLLEVHSGSAFYSMYATRSRIGWTDAHLCPLYCHVCFQCGGMPVYKSFEDTAMYQPTGAICPGTVLALHPVIGRRRQRPQNFWRWRSSLPSWFGESYAKNLVDTYLNSNLRNFSIIAHIGESRRVRFATVTKVRATRFRPWQIDSRGSVSHIFIWRRILQLNLLLQTTGGRSARMP